MVAAAVHLRWRHRLSHMNSPGEDARLRLLGGSVGLQASCGALGTMLTFMGLFQVVRWGSGHPMGRRHHAHPNGALPRGCMGTTRQAHPSGCPGT